MVGWNKFCLDQTIILVLKIAMKSYIKESNGWFKFSLLWGAAASHNDSRVGHLHFRFGIPNALTTHFNLGLPKHAAYSIMMLFNFGHVKKYNFSYKFSSRWKRIKLLKQE